MFTMSAVYTRTSRRTLNKDYGLAQKNADKNQIPIRVIRADPRQSFLNSDRLVFVDQIGRDRRTINIFFEHFSDHRQR